MIDQKIELLSPAGDIERLNSSINFGADAVYLASTEFGMRTASANFDDDNLAKAVAIAHKNDVKVYLTCNTLPRNNEISRLPDFLCMANNANIDAFIISDIGVFNLAQKYAPNVDIHISTQAGIVNFVTARTFYDMGAKRVVLARELSLEEISEIRDKTNKNLEIEAFVHGSMCVSFSGRCLISNYLTNRDSNRGDCCQPCRWKYHLVEETRPGEYFPINENNEGTYLLNSKDLCMIEHIPELVKAGITSFKIEGRAKSAYYTSVVTNAYRHAIDDYEKDPEHYSLKPWILQELEKVSHREYSTGFFFGNQPGQVTSNGGYVRNYDVVAVVDGYDGKFLKISQRNKFYKGDILDVLPPKGKPFNLKVLDLFNEYNQAVDYAPHAMQTLFIPSNIDVPINSLLRKKR